MAGLRRAESGEVGIDGRLATEEDFGMSRQGTAGRSRIPGGWLGRLLVLLVLVLGAVELVWVVGANLALRGTAVRKAANEKPEELWMDWRSAATWWPGRIRLEAGWPSARSGSVSQSARSGPAV